MALLYLNLLYHSLAKIIKDSHSVLNIFIVLQKTEQETKVKDGTVQQTSHNERTLGCTVAVNPGCELRPLICSDLCIWCQDPNVTPAPHSKDSHQFCNSLTNLDSKLNSIIDVGRQFFTDVPV